MHPKIVHIREELQTRPNSIDPPYPSFAEHITSILEHVSAEDLAQIMSVREDTIHDWASGGNPGTQNLGAIRETLGYERGEYYFRKVAQEVGFPVQDSKDPAYDADLAEVVSVPSLRKYVKALYKKVRKTEVSRLTGVEVSTLGNFIDRELSPREDMLHGLLRGLLAISLCLDGRHLTVTTPHSLAVQIAESTRLRAGFSIVEWADHLSDDQRECIITNDYYSGWKGRKVTPDQPGFFRDRERVDTMLRRIGAVRKRLKAEEAGSVSSAATSQADKALLKETYDVHGSLHELRRHLEEKKTEIDLLLSRTHAVLEQYDHFECDEQTPTVSLGRRPNGSKDVTQSLPAHLPPLSKARGKKHSHVPDPAAIMLLKLAMMLVVENMGQIMLIEDEEQRQRICDELGTERNELTIAVRAMSLKHPFGQFDHWDSQRRLMGDHPDVPEIQEAGL